MSPGARVSARWLGLDVYHPRDSYGGTYLIGAFYTVNIDAGVKKRPKFTIIGAGFSSQEKQCIC
ncbi:hypothetical protein [Methylobacter svalbardensis]|uniref:hypothetical protein n=1 Tax=Methylobacter svalbardensis TaxID=3080016 RepID=UPI0030EB7857